MDKFGSFNRTMFQGAKLVCVKCESAENANSQKDVYFEHISHNEKRSKQLWSHELLIPQALSHVLLPELYSV